ncbi:MAG TPA: lytic transglycosylase domain-containing protein [Terriglobales bacterium]|nr:lytic transglycosylase domain-containing protein [Terriglobales bacterium]
MKQARLLLIVVSCWCCANAASESRQAAEYYVAAYAQHYQVPVEFVRAIVEQESGWQVCPISSKGAAGLMQLMPTTARRLHVQNRCDLNQNVSGGVRYLAWLMSQFHGDLRLVAGAYYAGEWRIERRGLNYSRPDVVRYVAEVRARFERQTKLESARLAGTPGRTR